MLDDAASDANRTALEALGQLWLAGVSLDWRWVDAAERMLGSQRIALPGTVFLHRSANCFTARLVSAYGNPRPWCQH